MATKARGKIVRRLGVNLYGNPKYDRLLKRKSNPPGMDKGRRVRKKDSEYSRQLLEKQKLKFSYGLSERQFRNLFEKAKNMKGVTGDNMLALLERRIDNVVYRMGMATTRPQARQLVSHGHIMVNGRSVDIPSMVVKSGDSITVKERNTSTKLVRASLSHHDRPIPGWITVSVDDVSGKIERLPVRSDIPTIANELLVIEYYAK
ncbi:MAG TPA: 30S ribosomal protein S4 [Spirochaetia bacterium]|nr:30S ribosomal protein S4 [Spirochaetia bacterium]